MTYTEALVSIIIPAYNHQKELNQTLTSIANQTYTTYEVIVVDDGSKKPVEVPKALSFPEGVFVKTLRQENKGAPAARNRGLQEAKGEYVIFWDADAIGEPDMLEKMVGVLLAYPDVSYVYCNFTYGLKKMQGQEFRGDKLREQNYIHSTSLIRHKDTVEWDESIKRFQDWDLWLTLLEQGKVGKWIPQYLFHIIPHRYGISSWLPSFAYKKPWRYLPGFYGKVRRYEGAKAVITKKHP